MARGAAVTTFADQVRQFGDGVGEAIRQYGAARHTWKAARGAMSAAPSGYNYSAAPYSNAPRIPIQAEEQIANGIANAAARQSQRLLNDAWQGARPAVFLGGAALAAWWLAKRVF